MSPAVSKGLQLTLALLSFALVRFRKNGECFLPVMIAASSSLTIDQIGKCFLHI